ncbi:MAG: hypothetical protein ACOWWR_18595 [Eubacteriales bacterium]
MLNDFLDFVAKLVEVGKEPVEAQLENAIKMADIALDVKVAGTATVLDDTGKEVASLALRDYLIKKYPLEDYPLD